MNDLRLNGIPVKAPKTFKWDIMDIDGQTSRTASGDMQRDVITKKRKLSVEWGPMSDQEISLILQAIDGVFFQATYPDALAGGVETRTFYTGDRSAPSFSWNAKLQKIKWNGLTANFIEQ